MITFVSALGGAAWGALLARRRNGSRLDMAQYAAGFGILCAILGFFASLILQQMLL